MNEQLIPLYKSMLKYEINLDIQALSQTVEERLKNIPIFGDILIFKEKRENIIEMNGLNRAVEKLDGLVSDLVLQKKIDQNYIKSCQREIYFIFKFFLNAVYNQPDEEFIDFLSQYVCNCINEDFSSLKIKVSILNKIAKYTKQHIEVLKYIFDDSKEHGWPNEIKNEDYNWQKQIEKIPQIEPAIIKYCWHELLNDGFIFQKLGTFSGNTYSPYEITEVGVQCLKMMGYKID